MSKFSEFLNKNGDSENVCKKEEVVNREKLEDLIDKYSTYSQTDLISEFMKLTNEKKKKGELNESEMNSLKQTISPFLNDEQKNNLDKIMNVINNVK